MIYPLINRLASTDGSSWMAFRGQMPDMRMRDYEMQLKNRAGNHPDRPPRRRPGDGYTIIGFVLGMIVGGFIGNLTGNIWLFIGLIIGGGIAGTSLGSYVHTRIKKQKQAKREAEKESEQSGPFKK